MSKYFDLDSIPELLKFKPRCMDPVRPKEFGHSAQGHLIPCCWMDKNNLYTMDDVHEALFADHLKLKNFDSIDELLLTDEWQEFYNALLDINKAPKICLRKCSRNKTKQIL